MAITVQAGTGAITTGAEATLTSPLPASVVAGDLLLLLIDLSADTTVSSPGYSEIHTDTSSNDGFHVLKKTAGGSETAPVATFGIVSQASGKVIRIRDCDTATGPAQLTAQTSTTTTASIDPPTTGSVKIGVAHIDPPTSAGAIAWSGGTTDLGDAANAAACYVSAGYKLEDSAGALTFSWSGSGTPGTLILSIAPAGAGGSTFVPRVIAVT